MAFGFVKIACKRNAAEIMRKQSGKIYAEGECKGAEGLLSKVRASRAIKRNLYKFGARRQIEHIQSRGAAANRTYTKSAAKQNLYKHLRHGGA